MGGKAKGVGKRGVGSSKSRKTHKQGLRAQFESRHLDQIWEDVRKAVTVHDGKTAPVGTTDRCAKHSFIVISKLPDTTVSALTELKCLQSHP